jgi:hypothetical protein
MNSKKLSITIIPDQNPLSIISKEILKEGESYLNPQSSEEDMPIKIEKETNIKYYNLEQIFNTFYSENSLSIAKDKSREERENKKINDNSFVYGEIV